MKTRSVEIDFDVHKLIEVSRKDFEEPDNNVLRRLLGIDVEEVAKNAKAEGRSWVGKGFSKGLNLPHGTELHLHYNTTNIYGVVEDGWLVFDGQRFASPSAANCLCRTKDGKTTSLNGKKIIDARLPGTDEWVRLDALERRMKKQAG